MLVAVPIEVLNEARSGMEFFKLSTEMIDRCIEGGAGPKAEAWDLWYSSLPCDLRKRLSLHDFKRLGECFKEAFGIR